MNSDFFVGLVEENVQNKLLVRWEETKTFKGSQTVVEVAETLVVHGELRALAALGVEVLGIVLLDTVNVVPFLATVSDAT
jgi:hypothetical protein